MSLLQRSRRVATLLTPRYRWTGPFCSLSTQSETSSELDNATSNLRPLISKRKRSSIYRNVLWLLDHARSEYIPIRQDGHIPVSFVLAHPLFDGIDTFTLERVIREDNKRTFSWVYGVHSIPGEPLRRDSLWLGYNKPESRNISGMELTLLHKNSKSSIRRAVYLASEKEWETIAKNGLSRSENGYIRFVPDIGHAWKNDLKGDAWSRVIISVDLLKAFNAKMRFYLTPDGALVTRGNQYGYVDPQFFTRVERLTVKRTTTFIHPLS